MNMESDDVESRIYAATVDMQTAQVGAGALTDRGNAAVILSCVAPISIEVFKQINALYVLRVDPSAFGILAS